MKLIDQLRAFLDREEPGISAEFEEEELLEYIVMAKDDVKGRGLRYGQKRVVLRAASCAMFALSMGEMIRGTQSKVQHYDQMKTRFYDMFEKQVRGEPSTLWENPV